MAALHTAATSAAAPARVRFQPSNSQTLKLSNFQTFKLSNSQTKKRKPAAPYSPAGESRSTLGEEALDFRVRNGNGYDSLSMATGKRIAESTV